MLAVLDPLLLQFDDASGLEPLPRAALDDLVWMLAKRRALIPGEGSYWKPMVTEILRPLAQRMAEDPHYKRLLDQLMRQAQQVTLVPIAEATELSGFDLMFDRLGPSWSRVMRHLLARCARTDETILVTRLVQGRNARVHDHDGRPALVEKVCWELGVSTGGRRHRVPCVCNSRNLALRWTCRYADGLPAHEDGATFPFCPPPDPEWADPGHQAWRTHQSRPTWADRLGHFWAEPAAQEATGRSYHWDVYLSKAATPEYGLSQLNIGRWRPAAAQDGDGQPPPGALHHVPEGKRGRLKKESGWLC